jgi:hypothetical protein
VVVIWFGPRFKRIAGRLPQRQLSGRTHRRDACATRRIAGGDARQSWPSQCEDFIEIPAFVAIGLAGNPRKQGNRILENEPRPIRG